jgi:uncharacterized protein (UPF0276 family)
VNVRGTAATSREHADDVFSAGVGLRLPHLSEVAAGASSAAWLEAHPENFLANQHARELLLRVRHHHAVALHTVGVSVGSATGVDRTHLARIRVLIDELDPFLVSGHLAWSTHDGVYLNDLLPIPYDDDALRTVVANVHEVQDALRRCYVVENPASYASFSTSTRTETDFLTELVSRTGCRLLCDVSNAYLSAANLGYDAYEYIDGLPGDAVAELHLGGFTRETDDAGAPVLIDTHASAIAEPVWELYTHALRRFGALPTLIEWDNALPKFAELLSEAKRADFVVHTTLEGAARAGAA